MRSAAIRGAAFLLVMGACDLNFTEPPRDTKTRLFLSVISSDSAAGSLRVTGSLAPGYTEQGVLREVENEALIVGGEEVLPTGVLANGVRVYQKEWTGSSLSSIPLLVIHAPQLAGVQTAPPSLELRIPRRLGSERVHVRAGAPIPLRLASPDRSPPGLLRAFWQLTVSDPGRRMSNMRVQAEGFPPDVITVPAEWVPTGAGPDLSARLLIGYSTESAVSSSYVAALSLSTELFWSIQRDGG